MKSLAFLKDFEQQGWQTFHNRHFDRTCGACFKNNIFEFCDKTYILNCGTAIKTKFILPYEYFLWQL